MMLFAPRTVDRRWTAFFAVLASLAVRWALRYRWLLMEVIAGLKKTVLSVFHELNFACAFCDYLFVLNDGRVASQGMPQEICTPALLADVFRVRAEVLSPENARPYIVYRGSV